VICPYCRSGLCHRSHRRGLRDRLGTICGLRPWKCDLCRARFYAWSVPVAFAGYAHCAHCGNLDLQRISRDLVDRGPLRWPMRMLRVRAYRCGQCRRRFFSLRPYRRIVSLHIEALSVEESVGGGRSGAS